MVNKVVLDSSAGDIIPFQIDFFNAVMEPVSRYQQLGIMNIELLKLDSEKDPEKYDILVTEIDEITLRIEFDNRYFFCAGSIRAGKTIICHTVLVILCLMFPRSKWVIVRESFTRLITTSVKSMESILGNSWHWKRSQQEYFTQAPNGSRIYFMAEGHASDPGGHKFLGLEVNGFCLEQMEELHEVTYDNCLMRCGSWHGTEGPPPPPLMVGNFNPNEGWSKKNIVVPWKSGKLAEDARLYFIPTYAKDNPYNTKEQQQNWKKLDPATYERMIEGNWDIEVKNAFLYCFDEKLHTAEGLELNHDQEIGISFDFNVDPMTCIIFQTDRENFFYVIKAFSISNSDTYELCRELKPYIEGREHMVIVTGDASGKNRMSGLPGHINHYQIIASELGLRDNQFKIPGANPRITDSRVFCNSIVANFPDFKVDSSLEGFIEDLKFTVCGVDKEGKLTILKTGLNPYLSKDNSLIGHSLDNLRYSIHATLYKWLKVPKS